MVKEEVGQAESEIRTVTTGPLPDVFVPFTVTLHNESQVQKGYTLLGPVGSKAYAFAVDEQGEIVWYHRSGGYDTTTIQRDMVLLEDGTLTSLLYLNTTADGELIQSLAFDTELDLDAHELVQGPDGSFATLTRDEQVFDGTALRGGGIVEAAPTGEVSFEWNAFDHLDTSRFPTYPSTSTTGSGALDWAHANAIQYLEEDNAYLLSLRNQNMVYKIDRATGEVIWSLGDDGDFTLTSGEWFYAQHGPHLLPDGRIAIYDNGNSRPDTDKAFSRGVIYQLDEDAMTAEQVWEYRTDYYTGRVGNIFILDNDNVLVCAGGPDPPVVDDKPAGVYEVTQGGEVVWSFEEFESTSDGESTPIIYRSRRLESFYPDGSRKRQ